jgi:hypothetical protein
MATTTNYGWTTPDDTALVKDGALAIRTLGSSVDTTTKALNPSTTLGDIEYRSSTANTNTRLGIGSTGDVLTVAGGVPSWAAPGAGDLKLINTTTFSSVASQSINDVFSTTYTNYKIIISNFIMVGGTANFNFRLRVSGSDLSGSVYNYQAVQINDTASYFARSTSQTSGYLGEASNVNKNLYSIEICDPFTTNQTLFMCQTICGIETVRWQNFANTVNNTTSYTGFTFFPSSNNMTGTVSVYGYNK